MKFSYMAQKSGKGYLLSPATRYKGLIRCEIRKTQQGVLSNPIYSLYIRVRYDDDNIYYRINII